MNWVVLGWFCTAQADMLQTPPLESKKDADKILSISKRMLRKEKGIKVKRGRYLVPQKGYRFRVVVEGLNDLERSKKLASRLQGIWEEVELVSDTGQTKIFDKESNDFSLVLPSESIVQQASEKAEVEQEEKLDAPKAEDVERQPQEQGIVQPVVTDILLHAKKGMEPLSKRWDGIQSEQFFFERELLHDGKKVRVDHRFFQKGDAMRLEIQIQEGEGEDSVTVLTPKGEGVLSVNDTKQKRSADRTQEILKTFTSKAQFSILASFPKDIQSNGPWRLLDGVEKLHNSWRLYQEDSEFGGTIKQAIFSEKEGWLVQLVVRDEEGELEYRWTNYTDIGDGTFVPFQITRIRNGYIQETIKVKTLYFDSEIADSRFIID